LPPPAVAQRLRRRAQMIEMMVAIDLVEHLDAHAEKARRLCISQVAAV